MGNKGWNNAFKLWNPPDLAIIPCTLSYFWTVTFIHQLIFNFKLSNISPKCFCIPDCVIQEGLDWITFLVTMQVKNLLHNLNNSTIIYIMKYARILLLFFVFLHSTKFGEVYGKERMLHLVYLRSDVFLSVSGQLFLRTPRWPAPS